VSRHEEKRARLLDALRARGTGGVGLAKRTSNLFRDRTPGTRPRIDLSGFNEVLRVDVAGGRVEAEGMTTYADLAEETLAHGVMPCVVPQLKSITLGGAAAGVGIEASSFRYGLVHDTLLALDVLLADGSIVACTPENEHRDLFFGFPNSYGTLGYALKVTARTVPVKPYVRIEHIRHTDPKGYFEDLEARCRARDADFVDGTVFSSGEMYIRAHLLPLDPREEDRHPHHARLHLALGHRLVLVLEEPVCPEPARPPAPRPRAAQLDHLRESDALEQQVGHHARLLPVGGEIPRVGHPGRRHSHRQGERVPRVLPQGGRYRSGLDLPHRR
jgi:FAD/FMN-containing dehydrogenase